MPKKKKEIEGYCAKCKANQKMKDVKKVTKDGKTVWKGKCTTCGAAMEKKGKK